MSCAMFALIIIIYSLNIFHYSSSECGLEMNDFLTCELQTYAKASSNRGKIDFFNNAALCFSKGKCQVENSTIFFAEANARASYGNSFVELLNSTLGKNLAHLKKISRCIENYVARLTDFLLHCLKDNLKEDTFGQLPIRIEFIPLMMDYVYIRDIYSNYYFDLIFKKFVCGKDSTNVNVKSTIDCLANLFDQFGNSCQNTFDDLAEEENLKFEYCKHNCIRKLGSHCGNMSSLLIPTACECWRYVAKLGHRSVDPDFELRCFLDSPKLLQYYEAVVANEMTKRFCSTVMPRASC